MASVRDSQAELLEQLSEEVQCPVCLELFNDPRVLPCFHTFCSLCLGDLSQKSHGTSVQCPLCRIEHRLDAGVLGLPVNHYLANISEKLRQLPQNARLPTETPLPDAQPGDKPATADLGGGGGYNCETTPYSAQTSLYASTISESMVVPDRLTGYDFDSSAGHGGLYSPPQAQVPHPVPATDALSVNSGQQEPTAPAVTPEPERRATGGSRRMEQPYQPSQPSSAPGGSGGSAGADGDYEPVTLRPPDHTRPPPSSSGDNNNNNNNNNNHSNNAVQGQRPGSQRQSYAVQPPQNQPPQQPQQQPGVVRGQRPSGNIVRGQPPPGYGGQAHGGPSPNGPPPGLPPKSSGGDDKKKKEDEEEEEGGFFSRVKGWFSGDSKEEEEKKKKEEATRRRIAARSNSNAQPKGPPPTMLAEFSLKPERVDQLVVQWMKGRWFAPVGFMREVQRAPIYGFYIPFYQLRFEVRTDFTAQVLVEVRDPRGGGSTTRWSSHSDTDYRTYTQVLACASRRPDAWLIKRLNDWDQRKLHFAAVSVKLESPVPSHSVWKDGLEEMVRAWELPKVQRSIKRKTGARKTDKINHHVSYRNIHSRVVYLPVYCTSYVYKGQAYPIVINGQTGTVDGERPYGMGAVGEGVAKGASFLATKLFG